MIDYNCDKCGQAMSSPDKMAGGYETCPTCGARNAVPLPGAPADTAWGQGAVAVTAPARTAARTSPRRPVSHVSHAATIPESALRVFGHLMIAGSVCAFIFFMWVSFKTDRATPALVGLLYAVAGLAAATWYFAAGIALRYLRKILTALERQQK